MIDWDSCVLWLDSKYFSESYWWDRSRYRNNGVVHGAKWKSDAFYFDGIDDYVEVSDNDSLDITEELTIEALINPVSCGNSGYGRIIDKGYGSAPVFWVNCDFNSLEFNPGGAHSQRSNSNILQFNTVQHVVVRYISNSGGAFFHNGKNAGNIENLGNIGTNSQNLVVGNRADQNRGFDGQIRILRYYKRALSDSEIEILCNLSLLWG